MAVNYGQGGGQGGAPQNPKPKKAPKKQSFMDKIVGGIKSAGSQIKSDFQHATGSKPYTGAALDDYKKRSADSREAHMKFLESTKDKTPASGIASLKNTTDAQAQADQYAENLRRYNEYMESQQPQGPAVTPDMRRAALQTFESQRGAGQMPYYMAAAAQSQDPDMSPAFQYAAQNYATLGGSQRLGPRPMEMMSVAERRQINDMAQAMADQAAQQQAAQNQYQQGMDVVMRGGGKGGPAVMPQTGGQFNSMEELMDFQNKNPHMNLMGEYQRLKALEGGGATMPQTGGGMPKPPLPFASMLAQRFGGMY